MLPASGQPAKNVTQMWYGYADAKPSEAIQKHELPGLAVAVMFPHHPSGSVLELPIKQYKDCKSRKKGACAIQLAKWLREQKKSGLVLSGFVHAHTQLAAARLGLELVEELPETRVESHYETYRLFFGNEHIDFSQAIALAYYFFTMSFGILKASKKLHPENRRLFLAMDRFPGPSTERNEPGRRLPQTDGAKFMGFIRQRSDTGAGIESDNRSIALESKWGTLDWWKRKKEETWRKGKTHPHFILVDWLAAAAIANEFRDEFLATFQKEADGVAAADGLEDVYNTFKSFDLWSMDSSVLQYLRAGNKLWTVPDDAREFILARAER